MNSKADLKNMMAGLADGSVTREQLQINATCVPGSEAADQKIKVSIEYEAAQ